MAAEFTTRAAVHGRRGVIGTSNYLATETGLVQCLHEIELKEPIQHRERRAADRVRH